jgi:hypothetical protein
VDKASAARVNTNVINVPAVDAEEDEVAGRKRIQRDWARRALLRVGGAWNLDTRTLVDVNR